MTAQPTALENGWASVGTQRVVFHVGIWDEELAGQVQSVAFDTSSVVTNEKIEDSAGCTGGDQAWEKM
jgi:hypothetical protein